MRWAVRLLRLIAGADPLMQARRKGTARITPTIGPRIYHVAGDPPAKWSRLVHVTRTPYLPSSGMERYEKVDRC